MKLIEVTSNLHFCEKDSNTIYNLVSCIRSFVPDSIRIKFDLKNVDDKIDGYIFLFTDRGVFQIKKKKANIDDFINSTTEWLEQLTQNWQTNILVARHCNID